jgi:spore germination cell wall hydrolase CwlJ-like protein
MLPVGLVLAYNDYQNRLLESNPEVYGLEVGKLDKPNLLAPSLPDQKEIIALNAYQEARGEGKYGMIAVTNTVRHRLNDPEFPKTYRDVIYQPKQFSWTANKDTIEITEEGKWKEALHIAELELKGKLPDLANGARYYANVAKVDAKKHKWVTEYVQVAKVGNHTFMDKPTYIKAKGIKPIVSTKTKQTNKPKKA